VARPRTIGDDAVLDAAAALIGRVGPAKLTLAHVAGEIGLSPATLVQRFGSKRGLLLAVARRPLDFGAVFGAARAAEPTALGAVAAGLAALTAPVRTPEALANSLAFLQLDLADEEFHAEALAHFAAMRAHVEAVLREAVEAGELRGADPAALAETLVTTYNGALITWAVLRDGPLEDWLWRQVEAVLRPLRA
jgi:AcrR family transcriptional regulator